MSLTISLTRDTANDIVHLIENKILINTKNNYNITGKTLTEFKNNWKRMYDSSCSTYSIEVWKETNRLEKLLYRLKDKL